MKRWILGALAIVGAVAWSSPNDDAGPPPIDLGPFVMLDEVQSEGGTMDGRLRVFGCERHPCKLTTFGDWKITTASGTIVVRGGFVAEPALR